MKPQSPRPSRSCIGKPSQYYFTPIPSQYTAIVPCLIKESYFPDVGHGPGVSDSWCFSRRMVGPFEFHYILNVCLRVTGQIPITILVLVFVPPGGLQGSRPYVYRHELGRSRAAGGGTVTVLVPSLSSTTIFNQLTVALKEVIDRYRARRCSCHRQSPRRHRCTVAPCPADRRWLFPPGVETAPFQRAFCLAACPCGPRAWYVALSAGRAVVILSGWQTTYPATVQWSGRNDKLGGWSTPAGYPGNPLT